MPSESRISATCSASARRLPVDEKDGNKDVAGGRVCVNNRGFDPPEMQVGICYVISVPKAV